jgi:hypothetical protein
MEMNGAREQISGPKLQGLGDAVPRCLKEGEKQVIALAVMSLGIGGGEEGVNLLARHKPEHCFRKLLLWYGENPLTDGEELEACVCPSTNRTNVRIAASRRLRVRAELPRVVSRSSRKARTVGGLIVSRVNWSIGR